MADDNVRNGYYNPDTGKFLYWNGKEYAEVTIAFPEPPTTGTFLLTAIDGAVSWQEVS